MQPRTLTSESLHIREVWADNLEDEMAFIRDIVDDFPYLAMDTEFPGVVSALQGRSAHFNGLLRQVVDTQEESFPARCAAALPHTMLARRDAQLCPERVVSGVFVLHTDRRWRLAHHRSPGRSEIIRKGSRCTRRCALTSIC